MKQEQIVKELEELVKFNTCPDYIKNALSLIRRLEREKEEAVHKTIARVKIKCQRVSYADMAVPGVNHEIFTIKGSELDEIEKELTNVYQSKNQRGQ